MKMINCYATVSDERKAHLKGTAEHYYFHICIKKIIVFKEFLSWS